MKVVETIAEVRKFVAEARRQGKSVGFVPTMGALHAGHASLVARAAAETQFVVVSIFVNPTQFAPAEDLAAYPRTPRQDYDLCEKNGADVVFSPSVAEMYGRDESAPGGLTNVHVARLTETLCGASRPGHFDGVCTVVAKLFNIVLPDKAFFGAKDYQQSTVIGRMVRDLNMPVEIVVCPTVREADGLAMSSRNVYLALGQRRQASALRAALLAGAELIRSQRPVAAKVIELMQRKLTELAPDSATDYLRIVDPVALADVEKTDRPALLITAVRLGKARLIDNLLVEGPVKR